MNFESFIVKGGWSVIIPFKTQLALAEQRFVQHCSDHSLLNMLISPQACARGANFRHQPH